MGKECVDCVDYFIILLFAVRFWHCSSIVGAFKDNFKGMFNLSSSHFMILSLGLKMFSMKHELDALILMNIPK